MQKLLENGDYMLPDLKPKINLPQEFVQLQRFAVVDIETTGLDPATETIIEIASVIVSENRIVGELSLLLNPGIPIPAVTSKIHGLYDDDVVSALSIDEGLARFEYFVEEIPLIAHNANFDFAFIQNALGYPLPNKLYDSVALARSVLADQSSFGLNALCQHYEIINEQAHRALSDTRATAQVIMALINDFKNTPEDQRLLLFKASARNTYAIRGELKNAGFRWHRDLSLWGIYLSMSQVEKNENTYLYKGFQIVPHEF